MKKNKLHTNGKKVTNTPEKVRRLRNGFCKCNSSTRNGSPEDVVLAKKTHLVASDIVVSGATISVREDYEYYDALHIYKREIGGTKLLTPEEEVALARRIKRGDSVAREHMIKANLRLVVKIASEYDGLGLPFLDLISEGNIGLIKGVERFKPEKGAKLSTYAGLWIKQQIKRALANRGRMIRIPVHAVDALSKLNRTSTKLEVGLGRPPTDKELAKETGMSVSKVNRLRAIDAQPTSLDQKIGDSECSSRLVDMLEDDRAEIPHESIMWDETQTMLQEFLHKLTKRESFILKNRFGLNGFEAHTLEELKQKFRLSKEGVRKIQNVALRKLRAMFDKRA